MEMVYNTRVKKSVVNVRLRGFVQGIFFRSGTKEIAERLGLTGWVRNMPDGSVEAVFEGDDDRVKEALKWCRKGPAGASVSGVEEKWGHYIGEFDAFEIRYGY